MKGFYRKITLLTLCVSAIFSVLGAEKVTFVANAPMIVTVGETFRVEFSLNAKPDDNSFAPPAFTGFDVLYGPAVSQGSSIQVINGSMTKSVEYNITYVLSAQKAGNLTVEAAEAAVDGTVYRTKPLPIEAVDEGAAGSGSQSSGGDDRRQQQGGEETARTRLAKDDVLLRAIASQTTVFKGEPLRLTFKVYRRVPVVNWEVPAPPSFNGFWAQELTAEDAVWQRETLNGKVYESMVWREYLLYPQQAGTLAIDPVELTAVAQVVVQSNRSFDPFFGGGPEIYNVPRKLQTPKLLIHVKELPAGAPASFNGAVGSFTMDARYPADRLAANSAATYTVKITGTGNLPFVQAPRLNLPASFEQYNVKTTESIKSTSAGATGYRQFEYPFIARTEGDYRIDPVEFTFFNPEQMRYVTLLGQPFEIEIEPDGTGGGEGGRIVKGLSKEEVRLLGQDIRFIKLNNPALRDRSRPFFASAAYWFILFAVLALFGALYIGLRKRIRESQNLALMRGKRANKVAVQRFRAARRYMTEEDRHAFYEEMLRALWGYMSDKFNIPVANLTKENVREELHKRGVPAELSQRFTSIISQCDEAQYSPVASARMSDVYAEGVDLISRIESVIKR